MQAFSKPVTTPASLQLAHTHYENFPVASLLLPAHLRYAVSVIYQFAREADDIADDRRPPQAPVRGVVKVVENGVADPEIDAAGDHVFDELDEQFMFFWSFGHRGYFKL